MLSFTKTLIEFKTDISGASTKLIMIFSQKYDESLHGFDIAHSVPEFTLNFILSQKTM